MTHSRPATTMPSRTFVRALRGAALAVLLAAPAPAAAAHYHVDGARGHDSGPGSASAPWKTIARANRAAAGSTVTVAAGTYDDAPDAAHVTYTATHGQPVITCAVKLTGAATRIRGFRLAGGLDFAGAARGNVIEHCEVDDHWIIDGAADVAPRDNRISDSKLRVEEITAHTYGDDRDRDVARIVGPALVDCDVTVTRAGGVLWRWSGVDDAVITRSTIRLVNGGHHADDDASWKWFYVRRARITDCHIVLDHAADFSVETGPFAPMWRDSTCGTRMLRTTVDCLRGGMIFSPNTAGTWNCSCGDNRFEDVVLRAPGRLWFYQCGRPDSDRWLRSAAYAGRFERYNTGDMPSGLAVHGYGRHGKKSSGKTAPH